MIFSDADPNVNYRRLHDFPKSFCSIGSVFRRSILMLQRALRSFAAVWKRIKRGQEALPEEPSSTQRNFRTLGCSRT